MKKNISFSNKKMKQIRTFLKIVWSSLNLGYPLHQPLKSPQRTLPSKRHDLSGCSEQQIVIIYHRGVIFVWISPLPATPDAFPFSLWQKVRSKFGSIELARSIGHGGYVARGVAERHPGCENHLKHLHHKREWAFFGASYISPVGRFDPRDDSHPPPIEASPRYPSDSGVCWNTVTDIKLGHFCKRIDNNNDHRCLTLC